MSEQPDDGVDPLLPAADSEESAPTAAAPTLPAEPLAPQTEASTAPAVEEVQTRQEDDEMIMPPVDEELLAQLIDFGFPEV